MSDDTAAYLEELAATLASHGSNLAALRREALEQKVSPYLPTSGPAPTFGAGPATPQVGSNPVANTLGNTEPFTYQRNYLKDPTFETIPTSTTVIGTTTTTVGPVWAAHYVLVSGTAPDVSPPAIYRGAARGHIDNNFSSAMLEVYAEYAAGTTGKVEIYVYPTNVSSFTDTTVLPYIVASVGLTRLSGSAWNGTTATMELQLQEYDGGAWTTRATSPAQDAHDIGGAGNILRSFVAAYAFSGSDAWRPCFKIVLDKTGTSGVAQLYCDFGCPNLTFSYSPDAGPYSPAIAGWQPSRVVNNDVQVVGARVTGWGAPTGTATRTTFDTESVTLIELARRVRALVDDLTTHGLIGS